MQRYFLYLSYDGTNHHGWQYQLNGISIQERLTKAVATLLRYETEIVGAGRTDAGVHARLMVAHFDTQNPIEDTSFFIEKLNRLLSIDIAIQKLVTVSPDAHARFDALYRRYSYYVTDLKLPFAKSYSYKVHGKLDLKQMNEAAQTLLLYSDFTSFSKLHTQVKNNLCTITYAQWEQQGEMLVFTIQANRFLRNMVRAIVGTLLQVGRGQLDVPRFKSIIEQKDRSKAGSSAPGHGLFLEDVAYPDSIFIS